MSEIFKAVPAAMEAFSAAHQAAATAITNAGSVDSEAMLAAAAVAIGPLGAGHFHPAFATAVRTHLDTTLLVGRVHAGIAGATDASNATFVAADSA